MITGTQNLPMPPRPSSSLSDGSGPTVRAGTGAPAAGPPPSGAPPPGAMLPQPYPHHGPYKTAPYPPQPYGYPPRNHHPYPYGGYRPTPPPHPSQHYPPLKVTINKIIKRIYHYHQLLKALWLIQITLNIFL